MEDDMLKAQIKVVDILCDLELIYHPDLFDIMIHLVIYLPLEDLKGGPIRPQWMFPFERYMKKLKVDGVRYVVNNRDECHTTQNSGICSPGPDGEMYYGEAFKNDKYILVTEVKQVFYLKDKAKPHWKVVEHVNHKKFSNGGVIVVEDDPDIIYFDNSSNLPLFASLNDLDNATLHIDVQSTEVDAPPNIIDVPDEDDDIMDDEDALPHDLAYFDDEDLINVDDDRVDKMSVDVARSHGGDGGGVDRPPPHHVPTGCEGCFANRAKTQYDLRPHKESPDLTEIDADIQQHLQKAYNTNKASFKAQHWVIDPEIETYNVEKIRQARPEGITAKEWDKYMSHPQTGPRLNTCPEA
nr:hypothetical protein [Tanacetum cinerariifolium]